MKKYNYYRVIQSNCAGSWDDESFYETDSNYHFKTKKERQNFEHDISEYQLAYHRGMGSIRIIKRREINQEYLGVKQDLQAEITANLT